MGMNRRGEGEWRTDRKLEKPRGGWGRGGSRWKIHGEHLSRNIYESVAGNETDAEKRGGKNGRERAVGLQLLWL